MVYVKKQQFHNSENEDGKITNQDNMLINEVKYLIES